MSDGYRTYFVVVHGTGWSPGATMVGNPLATRAQAETIAEGWAEKHHGSPYSVCEVTVEVLGTLRARTVIERETPQ